MNSKKNKNKSKQNKQPNPKPLQKTEALNPAPGNSELVQQITKEVPEVSKNEERVPEITSECITPSVTEIKGSESDAPKKPKRNRGKKKKSETEDDLFGEKQQLDLEHNVQTVEVIESKSEAHKELPLDTTKAAPNARKKKNKNNDGQDNTENKKTAEYLAAQPLRVTMLTKSEAENIMSDVKIITCVPIAPEGSEQDGKKKRNKKKKRTDSEKSEKEEILACTAAFQKILEPREDKKDTKVVEQKRNTDKTAERETTEHVSLDMIFKDSQTLQPSTKETEAKNTVKDEDNKGNKKNKKDKKHPQNSEIKDLTAKQEIKDTAELPSTTMSDKLQIQEFYFEPIAQEETTVTEKQETKSPKPKAKISKPVEKKKKDLKNEPLLAEPLEKIGPSPVATVKPLCLSDLLPLEECPELEQEKELSKTIHSKPEKAIDIENKGLGQLIENIQVTKEASGKKGRKSPKPPKTAEELKSEVELAQTRKADACSPKQEVAEMPPLMPITEIEEPEKETNRETLDKTHKTKSEMQEDSTSSKLSSESKLEKEQKNMEPKIIPLPFTPLKTSSITSVDIEIKTPEQKSITIQEKTKCLQEKSKEKEMEAEIQSFQHIPSPDGGMGKKRKKSPRPSRKNDIVQESKSTSKDSSEYTEVVHENPKPAPADMTIFKDNETEIKPSEKESKPVSSKTIGDPHNIDVSLPGSEVTSTKSKITTEIYETTSGDIEVSSLGTESESSICDINPTVDYPRSSSQSADGNNNVSITEVVSVDESAPISLVEIKVDFPAVKATDKVIPPKVKPSMKTPRDEAKKSKQTEEKTDLKSKMIEVNQDMEGLRRSIEKSLAELSAIKNTEESTEQQFIQAQDKLDQIKNMALKQQVNIKESLIQRTENKEVVLLKPDFSASASIPQSTVLSKSESVEHVKPQADNLTRETLKTPEPPARKDNKGKGKSKKKGKQDTEQQTSHVSYTTTTESTTKEPKDNKSTTQDNKEKDKQEQKSDKSQEKGKQQSTPCAEDNSVATSEETSLDISKSVFKQFDPIENFEDALTSCVDDVNKSLEIITSDSNETQNNPEINDTEPKVETETEKSEKDKTDENLKTNPVSQPKNLLGRPEIPARSNKVDYKKEKNKTRNTDQAKVKIKDSVPIEKKRESKDTQTENKKRFLKNNTTESVSSMANENEEYVYKYSFRKVYLPNACHVCKSDLMSGRVPCDSCNLVFYCSPKHKDEDYTQHQALCFAVSTIVRLKDQKHLYSNAANITGQDYRLLRMQMIVSCEKVLERRLMPCEQEMLLYPRVCADAACREWRQELLKDCNGCGQISYCSDHPNHLPKTHQRWCKSYSLYHKLVTYQQVKGRLKPKLPTKVMTGHYRIPDRINEVLASMYEEKIDMSDIQYAALTQVATAPLTAAYCAQLHSQQNNSSNSSSNGGQKKSTFTIQVVGAELQFEADMLDKWEIFFLHLRPDVAELKVVLIGPELNTGNLPLDLLAKIKVCENCRMNKRRVTFDFQDKRSYYEYWSSDFTTPDIVCAFNPSIQRSSVFNGKDTWPSTIKCILKQKVPFVVTSFTMNELQRDLARIKEFSTDFNIVSEPKYNTFASVRPDRNFISDDEMPLLFKNYCYMVVCGAF